MTTDNTNQETSAASASATCCARGTTQTDDAELRQLREDMICVAAQAAHERAGSEMRNSISVRLKPRILALAHEVAQEILDLNTRPWPKEVDGTTSHPASQQSDLPCQPESPKDSSARLIFADTPDTDTRYPCTIAGLEKLGKRRQLQSDQ